MQILTLAQCDHGDVTLLRQILPIFPYEDKNCEEHKNCADSPHWPEHIPISFVARSWIITSDRVIAHLSDPQGLLTAKMVVPLTGLRPSTRIEVCPMNWAVAKTRGT